MTSTLADPRHGNRRFCASRITGACRRPRTMGSWTCLFLSSRRRRCRDRSLESSVDRIARFRFEPGAFTAPVVDYEPPPFDVAAVRPLPGVPPRPRCSGAPQLPAALRHPAPRPPSLRAASPPPPKRAASARFRSCAASGGGRLRRRGTAPGARGDRPTQADRSAAADADAPAAGHGLRAGAGAGPDKAAVLRRVRLRTAAVDERMPEPGAAEVFATYTRGRRVRAIAGRIEVKEGRWRVVALQIG